MGVIKVVYGKTDLVLVVVAQAYKAIPVGLFGPWLIGACCDCFFVGILGIQTHAYYTTFRRDATWIKLLVGFVFVFSCLKMVQSFLLIWTLLVTYSGDYKSVAIGTWHMWVEPIMAQKLSSTAQSFFVYRCFRLANNNWAILSGLLMGMVASLIVTIFLTLRLFYDPYYLPLIQVYMTSSLGINVAIDLFITITVTIQLVRCRRGLQRHPDYLLARSIILTWESALPPAICATLNLILFLQDKINTTGMLFNILTPRLYVFSLMHTLNSRSAIRSRSSMETSSGLQFNDHTARESKESIYLPCDEVHEIRILVQTETISYTTHAEYPPSSDEIQSSVLAIFPNGQPVLG
ncbi:hypothetical protein FRC02_010677 [Tulasnella sp. 418]|nr:hypothetical protein FRC02_010677 [Tulasnella sp. 418]